jgi:hypothetical protein
VILLNPLATSVTWNDTKRALLTTFAPILVGICRSVVVDQSWIGSGIPECAESCRDDRPSSESETGALRGEQAARSRFPWPPVPPLPAKGKQPKAERASPGVQNRQAEVIGRKSSQIVRSYFIRLPRK